MGGMSFYLHELSSRYRYGLDEQTRNDLNIVGLEADTLSSSIAIGDSDLTSLAWYDFVKFHSGLDDICHPRVKEGREESTLEIIDEARRPREGEGMVPPLNWVISAPDRGLKNRIVSKPHPGLVSRAHPIREKALALLMTDPRTKTVLKGDRKKAISEICSGFLSRRFLSADLTAATDRIPHQLALALWEGARQYLSVEDYDVVKAALGSQRLIYDSGLVIDSTCGILMGLPLSWVTLSFM
jgi:hypothetical protein